MSPGAVSLTARKLPGPIDLGRPDRFSRNIALFGPDGQQKIAATAVAIVGLGGLGSHVAQQLVHLGVIRFALIDDDVLTERWTLLTVNRLQQG
ncbi:MAG: ThiF family adenylyltransferase [Actinobacteria bacterium]|nr:ThiF family adenylyltransferase [Actinomycetota bacterium]